MSKIVDIPVTKETVSDDSYKVTSIGFSDGSFVKKGTFIGSFETSKADIDVESPSDGYVFYNCGVGDEVIVGSVFACISETDSLPASYFEKKAAPSDAGEKPRAETAGSMRISKPAEKLIQQYNIDIAVFKGKGIIEKKDVEDYLQKGSSQEAKKAMPARSYGPKSTKVIVIGGGNHSKVCIDILRQMHIFEIAGIVYTRVKPAQPDLMGCPVIGGLDDLKSIYDNVATNAVIGIGGLDNPVERASLFDRLKEAGYHIPNIIHPKSIIEPSVLMGEGNQVMGGANIGSCSVLGSNCIINSNTVISHDCSIGNNVHITPGATLAGTVKVGDNSIIGMGVTIYYNCSVGQNVIINNGHNIYKDIPDNSIIR